MKAERFGESPHGIFRLVAREEDAPQLVVNEIVARGFGLQAQRFFKFALCLSQRVEGKILEGTLQALAIDAGVFLRHRFVAFHDARFVERVRMERRVHLSTLHGACVEVDDRLSTARQHTAEEQKQKEEGFHRFWSWWSVSKMRCGSKPREAANRTSF